MKKLRKAKSKIKQSLNSPTPQVSFHKLNWLERLSIIVGLWFLIYPHPYTFLFTINLIIPIAGLIIHGIQNPSIASLVSISEKDVKHKYDIADFVEFPGLVIFIRVVLDFEFESFYSIIKVGTLSFILLLILLFTTHKIIEASNKNRATIYALLIANIALYSYAATYGSNCVYDYSTPKVYDAVLVDKHISRGRRTTIYYLTVTPWGNHKEQEDISVSSNQYYNKNIGETVKIDYKQGLLFIPWYYIEQKRLR